jgi:iron-sulfur cluster assembly protein
MSNDTNTALPVMPPPSASEGSEKGVVVTEKAQRQIRIALEKEGVTPAEAGMRLGVQGGGCSGLTYKIRVDSKPHERDRVYTYGDLRVFVDPKSFLYLNGMILDWEETLMQRGFVFKNPNASKSCGCGTSFSG